MGTLYQIWPMGATVSNLLSDLNFNPFVFSRFNSKSSKHYSKRWHLDIMCSVLLTIFQVKAANSIFGILTFKSAWFVYDGVVFEVLIFLERKVFGFFVQLSKDVGRNLLFSELAFNLM